ncbi:MAG: Brp/Blh family beta-carotene 15,15'-dioxygenase [Planctomycetaceae bacterium]
MGSAAMGCWHFGVAHLDTDLPDRHRGPRTSGALARGCGVLAVPLVAWPNATAAAATELASFAVGSDAAEGLFPPHAVMAAGVCLAAIGSVALLTEMLSELSHVDGPRCLRRLLGEVAAIVALGWFADPLFSVGLYFLAWHAWRQMEPLAEALSAPRFRSWSDLWRGLTRVHVASLPLLLPSLVAIGAVWWAWAPDHTLRSLALTSIGGYLIVTPAHELLAEGLRVPAVRAVLARLARQPAIRHAGASRVDPGSRHRVAPLPSCSGSRESRVRYS